MSDGNRIVISGKPTRPLATEAIVAALAEVGVDVDPLAVRYIVVHPKYDLLVTTEAVRRDGP